MIKRKKIVNNHKGISTIEFLFTFSFALSGVFMFVKTAYMFTNGYITHYVTFLASRAYLVSETQTNERQGSYQDDRATASAEKVFKSFDLPGLGIPKGTGLKFNFPQDGKYEYVGTWFEYEDTYSFTNLVGGTQKIKLRSESFLGKEPTRSECAARVCNAFNEAGMGVVNCDEMGSALKNMTFFDNGC